MKHKYGGLHGKLDVKIHKLEELLRRKENIERRICFVKSEIYDVKKLLDKEKRTIYTKRQC